MAGYKEWKGYQGPKLTRRPHAPGKKPEGRPDCWRPTPPTIPQWIFEARERELKAGHLSRVRAWEDCIMKMEDRILRHNELKRRRLVKELAKQDPSLPIPDEVAEEVKGLRARMEKMMPGPKLTKERRQQLRMDIIAGFKTRKALAQEYGISYNSVNEYARRMKELIDKTAHGRSKSGLQQLDDELGIMYNYAKKGVILAQESEKPDHASAVKYMEQGVNMIRLQAERKKEIGPGTMTMPPINIAKLLVIPQAPGAPLQAAPAQGQLPAPLDPAGIIDSVDDSEQGNPDGQ